MSRPVTPTAPPPEMHDSWWRPPWWQDKEIKVGSVHSPEKKSEHGHQIPQERMGSKEQRRHSRNAAPETVGSTEPVPQAERMPSKRPASASASGAGRWAARDTEQRRRYSDQTKNSTRPPRPDARPTSYRESVFSRTSDAQDSSANMGNNHGTPFGHATSAPPGTGPPPVFVPRSEEIPSASRARRPHSAPPQRSSSKRSSQEHLKVLGFAPHAQPSESELKRALREMAMQWHPDRPQNLDRTGEATEKFQAGKQAYDALMEDLKKCRKRP